MKVRPQDDLKSSKQSLYSISTFHLGKKGGCQQPSGQGVFSDRPNPIKSNFNENLPKRKRVEISTFGRPRAATRTLLPLLLVIGKKSSKN